MSCIREWDASFFVCFCAEREKVEGAGQSEPMLLIYEHVGAINKQILPWSCAFFVSYIAQICRTEAEEKEGF